VIECPVNHPALPALFDPMIPDHPALWAVLEGRHTGRAMVDNVEHPTQCVLRTDAALTYSSRQISQVFLHEAITRFQKVGPIWLIWQAALSTRNLVSQADEIVERLEFYDYDPHSVVLTDLRRRLPAGSELCPIDRQLIERCEWRSDIEFYCGSLDNFLVNGLGLCMMQRDEIIVEAYVSSFGEAHAEIGAVTHEARRGHGYAPIACAYLIQACEQRGYHAYWSCDADNLASIRVARKLGFRQEQAYQVLEYRHLI
jgi:GNAT superfamily N-acetyltransferase